jgi:hypothetical protein
MKIVLNKHHHLPYSPIGRIAACTALSAGLGLLCLPASAYDMNFANLGYSLIWPLTNTVGLGPYYVMNTLMRQSNGASYGYLPFTNAYANIRNYNPSPYYANYAAQGYPGYAGYAGQQQGYNQQNSAYPNAQSAYNPPTNLNPYYNQNYNPSQAGPNQQVPPMLNQQQSQFPSQSQNMVNGTTLSNLGPGQAVPNSPAPSGAFSAPAASTGATPAFPSAAPSPSLAPNRFNGKDTQLSQSSTQSPFAANFLTLLDSKYKGDVTHAFKDNDMQAWAQALNISVPSAAELAKFGHVRKQAISSVLKDPSLDAPSKIEALRILMR